jgi:fructose-1,6-bisphosphatase I
MPTNLEAFLGQHAGGDPTRSAVVASIREIARCGQKVWEMAREGDAATRAVETGVNPDGDTQAPLDVLADRMFLEAAHRAPIAVYASEEQAEPVLLDAAKPLALAIDPLDGSSNVELNLSFGTIFSLLPVLQAAQDAPLATFLQPGSRQLAAGLLIYGPRLALVVSVGSGTHIFAFSERTGDYRLVAADVCIPQKAREFAINASNYRHWDESVRLYFDDCVKGVHGPRERDFNMRWLASLVVEAYRIMTRGGVFLYPADRRQGYGNGRLRLVYEANPVAFLVEQAGGLATNGVEPILGLAPGHLHQRTPLVFGSGREVARLTRYHTEPSAIADRAPLFGQRGLFRV